MLPDFTTRTYKVFTMPIAYLQDIGEISRGGFMRHPIQSSTGNFVLTICLSTAILWISLTNSSGAQQLSPIEQLGKQLFFDATLSTPAGQSCASCHAPETGFTGPDSQINQNFGIYPGATGDRFGNRKPPSVAYLATCPPRTVTDDGVVGGQFWDGRANDLVEQAKGPFLNPLEMNNASAAEVVVKVSLASYRPMFEQLYGPIPVELDENSAQQKFQQIAEAIAAYESSTEVNPFSSKYDAYLAGRAQLSLAEQRGLELFAGKANCTACHPHEQGADGSPPLFTDFTYDNVGAPRNSQNPFLRMAKVFNPEGELYRDLGLGANLNDPEYWGQVKVPTLRNVARRPTPNFVKSYLHNGVFKSLKQVVHFYNSRDKTPDAFPAADVNENINRDELGDLGLTDDEENDLVAFLETLSDGYLQTSAVPADSGSFSITDPFRPVHDILRVRGYRIRTARQVDDGTAVK